MSQTIIYYTILLEKLQKTTRIRRQKNMQPTYQQEDTKGGKGGLTIK